MEVPNEILIVPLKPKQPRIKNKKRVLQIIGATISLISFLIYLFYYPAPSQFNFTNTIPISILITLLFTTVLLWCYLFVSIKKALFIALLITSLLAVNKSRIITIVTYAICLPLLVIDSKPKSHDAQPLPEKAH